MTNHLPTIETIDQINALDRDAFVARLGVLFEGSPWVAADAFAARPFRDRAALHRALLAAVARASDDRKLALIRAHPDLAGRAALAGTLGPASTAEQAAAGLDPDRLSAEEIAEFRRANDAYRQRFGFPFVVCAREQRKATILRGIANRLPHREEEEVAIALGEIGKIAWYRLIERVSA